MFQLEQASHSGNWKRDWKTSRGPAEILNGMAIVYWKALISTFEEPLFLRHFYKTVDSQSTVE
jgi:hypothetical protein